MVKPKYKKMYLEQRSKYNELLTWILYLIEGLEDAKIIKYGIGKSEHVFNDMLTIDFLNTKPCFVSLLLWDKELAEKLKGREVNDS